MAHYYRGRWADRLTYSTLTTSTDLGFPTVTYLFLNSCINCKCLLSISNDKSVVHHTPTLRMKRSVLQNPKKRNVYRRCTAVLCKVQQAPIRLERRSSVIESRKLNASCDCFRFCLRCVLSTSVSF